MVVRDERLVRPDPGAHPAVDGFTEAGIKAAPNSSVAVQLAALRAKAHARMGEQVERVLDEGFRLLARHERPARPHNHFVIDPTKWDFYAMDCFRIAGRDDRATEHAREVLRLSRRSDGGERSPMRAAEARLTLAVAALRAGDLDGALAHTAEALDTDRRSVDSLLLVATELTREARARYPGDPALRPLHSRIEAARNLVG